MKFTPQQDLDIAKLKDIFGGKSLPIYKFADILDVEYMMTDSPLLEKAVVLLQIWED